MRSGFMYGHLVQPIFKRYTKFDGQFAQHQYVDNADRRMVNSFDETDPEPARYACRRSTT